MLKVIAANIVRTAAKVGRTGRVLVARLRSALRVAGECASVVGGALRPAAGTAFCKLALALALTASAGWMTETAYAQEQTTCENPADPGNPNGAECGQCNRGGASEGQCGACRTGFVYFFAATGADESAIPGNTICTEIEAYCTSINEFENMDYDPEEPTGATAACRICPDGEESFQGRCEAPTPCQVQGVDVQGQAPNEENVCACTQDGHLVYGETETEAARIITRGSGAAACAPNFAVAEVPYENTYTYADCEGNDWDVRVDSVMDGGGDGYRLVESCQIRLQRVADVQNPSAGGEVVRSCILRHNADPGDLNAAVGELNARFCNSAELFAEDGFPAKPTGFAVNDHLLIATGDNAATLRIYFGGNYLIPQNVDAPTPPVVGPPPMVGDPYTIFVSSPAPGGGDVSVPIAMLPDPAAGEYMITVTLTNITGASAAQTVIVLDTGTLTVAVNFVPAPTGPGGPTTPAPSGDGGGGGAGFAGGAAVLLGVAFAYFVTEPDAAAFAFTPQAKYEIDDGVRHYRYGSRLEFRRDEWTLWWMADESRRGQSAADRVYGYGGEWARDAFSAKASAHYSEEDGVDVDAALRMEWALRDWTIRPSYRFRADGDVVGEWRVENALDLDISAQMLRAGWTIRPSVNTDLWASRTPDLRARFQIGREF